MKLTRIATLLLLAACSSPGADSRPPVPPPNPWSAEFQPPWAHDAPGMHLEVLRPEVAGLDYAAFMSSREHLRTTLHWGSWPSADSTLADNEKDLARHLSEYEKREAYAYTVLKPDRSECIGCIYLNPLESQPRTLRMAYWVTETELANDTDLKLFRVVRDWIATSWPADAIVLRLHVDNARGIALAQRVGFELRPETVEEHRVLIWERAG